MQYIYNTIVNALILLILIGLPTLLNFYTLQLNGLMLLLFQVLMGGTLIQLITINQMEENKNG